MNNEQLDRLAAEKVMGWQSRSGAVTFWLDSSGKYMGTSFSPTTNEQHAAMVREKMATDGWLVSTCVYDGEWSASVWRSGATSFVVTQYEPSMPYCQTAAALLAVEAITEEELNA